ncbi:hypothetical protein FA13DRAFT_1799618 [Coprinellus micaceus]|uniref:JmjC domain-containing protein n=1 Tax=Coprinellus micaceus TaxID=71717 RepID=A0A4Y7SK89_COPMI|nr:hypothetical protein FA13DRAFT_1799618 [Coprinellus micaceus]
MYLQLVHSLLNLFPSLNSLYRFIWTVQQPGSDDGPPPSQRKSLNALDFPNPHAEVSQSTYASDIRGVIQAEPEGHCIEFHRLPGEDIRFWLAATAGAHSYWHIDCRGEATWVHVATGQKIWFIAEPLDPRDLSSNFIWSSASSFDVRNLDLTSWAVQATLLTPGTRIFMRPNSLHTVYTDENSISQPPATHREGSPVENLSFLGMTGGDALYLSAHDHFTTTRPVLDTGDMKRKAEDQGHKKVPQLHYTVFFLHPLNARNPTVPYCPRALSTMKDDIHGVVPFTVNALHPSRFTLLKPSPRLYLCTMAAFFPYWRVKTFSSEVVATKISVLALPVLVTLQTIFVSLSYWAVLDQSLRRVESTLSKPSSNPIVIILAPASYLTSYLTACTAQLYSCSRVLTITKLSKHAWVFRIILVAAPLVSPFVTPRFSILLKDEREPLIGAGMWHTTQIIQHKRYNFLYSNGNSLMKIAVAIQSSAIFASESSTALSLCVLAKVERTPSRMQDESFRKYIGALIKIFALKSSAICLFAALCGFSYFFLDRSTYVFSTLFYGAALVYVLAVATALNCRERYRRCLGDSALCEESNISMSANPNGGPEQALRSNHSG